MCEKRLYNLWQLGIEDNVFKNEKNLGVWRGRGDLTRPLLIAAAGYRLQATGYISSYLLN